jgi:hypothetical protein
MGQVLLQKGAQCNYNVNAYRDVKNGEMYIKAITAISK